MKIMECVPNFSEGRDRKKVGAIADAILFVREVKLLDFSMDCDHHRSVFTFIGSPEDVFTGAMAACKKALDVIDMRKHEGVHPRLGAVDVVPFVPLRGADMQGVHPRLGAVDVVPFVPLRGADMQDAVALAHRFGREFAEKNQISVYFYGEAALHPKRKELSEIRRGGYEKLKEKIKDPRWQPDAGPSVFNDRAGATVVGARMPLIAFNVNLNTGDLAMAKTIAAAIRQSGGGLKHVRAIGVPLKSRKIVQISMNLTNYRETSVRTVFDAVKKQVSQHGAAILESELIGLVPEAALEGVSADYLQLSRFSADCIIETHLRKAI
ncbi:MAG: glutamate formimidoyltransferase [Deltaproteobacteria bacterium]|nr:glutamate formimidoyltransferase [Deltaproteobacteria bacterium]